MLDQQLKVKNKHTWWGDRPAGAPPPSWPLYLGASCTQRARGWGPAGPGSAAEPGWWPAHGAEWCSVPSRLRHSRSTWWRRCGRSPARKALCTGWLWRWAGDRCCETTWWLLPSAAGRTPRVLCVTPALSVNMRKRFGQACARHEKNKTAMRLLASLACMILESSSNDVLQSPLYSWASCWMYLLTFAEDVPRPAPAPLSS